MLEDKRAYKEAKEYIGVYEARTVVGEGVKHLNELVAVLGVHGELLQVIHEPSKLYLQRHV